MNAIIEKTIQKLKLIRNNGMDVSSNSNTIEDFNLIRNVPAGTPLCLAPWTSLSFSIDGYATICCLNKKTSVNIEGKTIKEIWESDSFNRLRQNVEANNLDYDCGICAMQIRAKNFSGAKAVGYDTYYKSNFECPQVMEFCLENTCNLACTMCNSLLSSTIRKNQKLTPSKKYYDEHFVNQLDDYIPYLQEAIFSGGEPFLIPLYFKIWEKIIRLNQQLKISVVTNGTILNDKLKDLLEQGRFNINISIDSVDKKTYESIRINADLDEVLKNFEWFRDYGVRKKLPVNIPICPLTTNWQTIPDIIRFANKNGASINFVYVERPYNMSLTNCEPDLLQEITSYYSSQKFDLNSESSKNNLYRFNGLIFELEKWKKNLSDDIDNIDHEDMLISWADKILAAEDISQPEGRDKLKTEIIEKLQLALCEVPADKKTAVILLLNKFSGERFYSFLKEKTPKEIATVFLEFAGR